MSSGPLTRDLTVLSRNFAVKIKPDFRGKRQPQNQPNLLQIRRISEQLIINEHNKKTNKQSLMCTLINPSLTKVFL